MMTVKLKWMIPALLCPLTVLAEITLPAVFSDHMVLQRGQAVPVWGTADAGETVQVRFADQVKTAKADADGKWRVELEVMPASFESRKMTVSSGEDSVTIADVLVGEVWLCGGQSNMDFTLNQFKGNARDPKYQSLSEFIRAEIAGANDPLLRHFKVERQISAFEEQTDAAGSWTLAVPGQVANFTGTGYFFGKDLRKQLNVPVALLSCNWGGTLVEPWIPADAFEQDDSLKQFYAGEMKSLKEQMGAWDEAVAKAEFEKKMADWTAKAEAAKAEGKKAPRKPKMATAPELSNRVPSTLYNGMLHSLVPYKIRGVIWYQGESNRSYFSSEYGQHFTALIESWRARWGQHDLPFIWCQLAAYTAEPAEPVVEDGWVTVCDFQRRTLSLPNTGMAVLNDIGQARDIHPKNKKDAGERLSLWALKLAYGRDVLPSGPLYKDSRIVGNKMVIRFDSVGSGLMVGKKHLMEPVVEDDAPLKFFQICGADGQWKWAQAKIAGNDTVEVWHPEIVKPVEVRYAWAANPEGANLYNQEGLPASVFTTSE